MVLYEPQPEQVRKAAGRRGLELSEDEATSLIAMGKGLLRSFERIDSAGRATLPLTLERSFGSPPAAPDNAFNAWVWRCDLGGMNDGILADQTVVVKDIIPVAGMPMTGGSVILDGYRATYDATVVTRVLEAGGTITGIATTEDLCMSAASVSAASGQVMNPRDPARSAGGSSSGVAALVAAGEVSSGIGADQGGSIRIPSSLCGVFGMKPTYGLVPYTGAAPIDPSADHLGPIAGSVEDLASLLQAIAGFDGGLDPRQRADFTVGDYLAAAKNTDIAGLKIGLLTEGFRDQDGNETLVDRVVLETADQLSQLGVELSEVSIPRQQFAIDLQAAILIQGASEFMMRGYGAGLPGKGFYDEQIGTIAAGGMALHSDQLFAAIKYCIGMGGYLWDAYGGSYYAKAQNLALALRQDYDQVFEEYDLLILPTTRIQAPLLPQDSVPGVEAVELAQDPDLIRNTCAFNHTGHPALSVPIGVGEKLPIGMMLVGPWYSEERLISVAAAMQNAGMTLNPMKPER